MITMACSLVPIWHVAKFLYCLPGTWYMVFSNATNLYNVIWYNTVDWDVFVVKIKISSITCIDKITHVKNFVCNT